MDQATWDQWEAERLERAAADLKDTAWMNAGPKGTEHLLERIVELEDRLYVKQVALECALELIERRAREHARSLELVGVVERCDGLLADPRQHRRAA